MSRLVVLIALSLFSSAHAATVRYLYDGISFDIVSGDTSGTNRVSGYFDIEDGLPANLALANVAVDDFFFSDGVTTVQPGQGDSFFTFSTDASGEINAWVVTLRNDEVVGFIVMGTASSPFLLASGLGISVSLPTWFDATLYESPATPPSGDPDGPDLCTGVACVPGPSVDASTVRGSWTATVIPLPPALWLSFSALGFLGILNAGQQRSSS